MLLEHSKLEGKFDVQFRYVGRHGGTTGPVHHVYSEAWPLGWLINRVKYFHYNNVRIVAVFRIG